MLQHQKVADRVQVVNLSTIYQREVGDLYQGPEGFLAPFRFAKGVKGVNGA